LRLKPFHPPAKRRTRTCGVRGRARAGCARSRRRRCSGALSNQRPSALICFVRGRLRARGIIVAVQGVRMPNQEQLHAASPSPTCSRPQAPPEWPRWGANAPTCPGGRDRAPPPNHLGGLERRGINEADVSRGDRFDCHRNQERLCFNPRTPYELVTQRRNKAPACPMSDERARTCRSAQAPSRPPSGPQ